jgi:hypothetical protein
VNGLSEVRFFGTHMDNGTKTYVSTWVKNADIPDIVKWLRRAILRDDLPDGLEEFLFALHKELTK